MPDSIEDLVRRWKAQPDAAGAIVLCDTLRQSAPSARTGLVDELGKAVAAAHAADAKVLTAVARLYASIERLSDAQGLLISAGRVATRDPAVFRLLGEVLLRRGDAERAEKVFERAKQLGANDPETAMWMDRAKVFKPVQAKAGARAVAVEVKNTTVMPVTPHPGALSRGAPAFVDDEAPTRALAGRALGFVDDEAPTSIVKRAAIARGGPNDDAGRVLPTEVTVQREPVDFPRGVPLGSDAALPNGRMAPDTTPMPRAAPPRVARPISVAIETPPPLAVPGPRGLMFSEDHTEVTNGAPAFLQERAREAPTPGPTSIRGSVPSARDVLSALTKAGVFEPREAAGTVQWDRPTTKVRRRTAVGLAVGLVLFVAGSAGVLSEIHRRRALAHDEAEAALAKVETDLASSQSALLPQIEQTIGHAFELDSRSPRAAVDWLEERAMKGLLQGGAEIAFEDAMTRATEVKVPEEKIAFARVSAFLFQGDTGGAAGLLRRWDGPAASEPLYQLVTGATLDHAGDPHAAERYQAAAKLSPNLVIAEILLVRAMAVDGDATKAAELAKQFRAKHEGRPEGAALVALAWARDPARGEQAPPEVAEAVAHASELPLPLLVVPHALLAIAAIDKHQAGDAKAELEKGLAVADDPGMATWLGSLALDTRDEPLIRKAALLAVTFSAVYAPARVLAGRIALLGGRLDEALKATEDLDPASPDVAIVRAAAAYERSDADAMGRALEAVPAEAGKLPVFTALNVAPDILIGRPSAALPHGEAPAKLRDMSSDDAPWSDLVAMDAALDLGLIDVADKIRADWKGTEDKPLKALRLSRLSRYEDHLDDADRFSKTALETATVTPRMLIERVMVLVARNRFADVGPLLAHYPLVLGPSSSWLSAYALASTGKLDEARGRTAQLDVPPALSPLAFRVMTAVSLAAMKDKKRAEPAIAGLLAAGVLDPDLLAAAASLGVKVKGVPARPGGRRR